MIETYPDAEALAAAAADAVLSSLQGALHARGLASLAATGGRSPAPVYDRLALAPLDWSRVRVTLTDERWVDVSSPDSNEGLVRRHLLQHRASDVRLFGLRGHEQTPEAAADQASAVLHTWPPLDVAILGMGEDGHVASLFPGSPALARGLDPASPACIAVPAGEGGLAPAQPRLTLTLGPLARAGLVLILTSGAAKRAVLDRALEGGDPLEIPVRAVLQSAPSVRILWTP